MPPIQQEGTKGKERKGKKRKGAVRRRSDGRYSMPDSRTHGSRPVLDRWGVEGIMGRAAFGFGPAASNDADRRH